MSAPKKPSNKGGAPKGSAKIPPAKEIAKASPAKEAPKAAPVVDAAPVAAPPAPAAPVAPVAAPARAAHRAFRRKLIGHVTSNKMAKTVVVEVVRSTLDPMYKKYVRSRERYKAHDETNQYKTGDRVEIQEHRPISRDKRWLVTRLVSRPVSE